MARFYFALLALFTVGRWAQSLAHFEYATHHHQFSIVTLTLLSSAYFAAFCRRWRGYGLPQAVMLGMTMGLAAQVVIFASTAISYAFGLHTFSVVHRTADRAFAADVPYVFAVVELDEGPRLTVNVVDAALETLECDIPVRVVFTSIGDDTTVPNARGEA